MVGVGKSMSVFTGRRHFSELAEFNSVNPINVGFPYSVIVVVIHTAYSWPFVLITELSEDGLL